MSRRTVRAAIERALCIGCGACIKVCPQKAIALQPGWFSAVDGALCVGCGKCVELCHKKAPALCPIE